MKFVRLLIYIVLVVLVFSAVTLGVLYYLFEPNKLKPTIIQQVKRETGYDLVIDGRLTWKVYPRIAINVPHMTLANPGQLVPFADMQNVQLAVDINQLRQGQDKIEGHISIANLSLWNVRMVNVATNLTWQSHDISLNPITASLYSGTMTGSIKGHDLKQSHRWDGALTLNDVQVKPLMQDVNPTNRLLISGTGNVSLQVESLGRSKQELVSGLNGKVIASITNGSVHGVDLNYLISSADALINRQPLPVEKNFSQTDFASLNAAATIQNGLATFTTLQLNSSAFAAVGDGTINLLSELLAINLQVTPQASLKTKWGVLVSITGNLSHPNVKLDADQMTKYTIKLQIDKAKDKAREAVQKHVPGKVGDYLQKLLSR